MHNCEVCGAEFPSTWKLPIRCSHKRPGKKYTEATIEHKRPERLTHDDYKQSGREAWLNLHRYEQQGEWSPSAAAEYYAEWKKTIPSKGCSCQDHWTAIEADHPPKFSTEREFIEWGFDRHNDVNRKLGKPVVPRHVAWEWRNKKIFFEQ